MRQFGAIAHNLVTLNYLLSVFAAEMGCQLAHFSNYCSSYSSLMTRKRGKETGKTTKQRCSVAAAVAVKVIQQNCTCMCPLQSGGKAKIT